MIATEDVAPAENGARHLTVTEARSPAGDWPGVVMLQGGTNPLRQARGRWPRRHSACSDPVVAAHQ